jgi:hypothetical protein
LTKCHRSRSYELPAARLQYCLPRCCSYFFWVAYLYSPFSAFFSITLPELHCPSFRWVL